MPRSWLIWLLNSYSRRLIWRVFISRNLWDLRIALKRSSLLMELGGFQVAGVFVTLDPKCDGLAKNDHNNTLLFPSEIVYSISATGNF